MTGTTEAKTSRKHRRKRRWTRLTFFELVLMSGIVGAGVTLTLVLLLYIAQPGGA